MKLTVGEKYDDFYYDFYDYDLLRDLICEKYPTTIKAHITFENVYWNNIGNIMAPFRDLIGSYKFSVSINEYKSRLMCKKRSIKLNNLGL